MGDTTEEGLPALFAPRAAMTSQQPTGGEMGGGSAEEDLARVLGAFGVGTADELVELARHSRPGSSVGDSGPVEDSTVTLSARCARAEREVRVLRALLLMKNVEVGTQALGTAGGDPASDLRRTDGEGDEGGSGPAGTELAGGDGVVEELLRLRAKVKVRCCHWSRLRDARGSGDAVTLLGAGCEA